MRPGGSHGSASRGTQGRARRPVLVVKVGGATADAAGEPTQLLPFNDATVPVVDLAGGRLVVDQPPSGPAGTA